MCAVEVRPQREAERVVGHVSAMVALEQTGHGWVAFDGRVTALRGRTIGARQCVLSSSASVVLPTAGGPITQTSPSGERVVM